MKNWRDCRRPKKESAFSVIPWIWQSSSLEVEPTLYNFLRIHSAAFGLSATLELLVWIEQRLIFSGDVDWTVNLCLVDKDRTWRGHGEVAGAVSTTGSNGKGSAGRADAVRHRRFPGMWTDELSCCRNQTLSSRTRLRPQGIASQKLS